MQGYKSESSALYEMQNVRSQCVATVGDCSKRPDRKRRTHVVRSQHVFVGWWLHESTLSAKVVAEGPTSKRRRGQQRTTDIVEWWLGAWTPQVCTGCSTSPVASGAHEELWCDRRFSRRTRRAAAFCTRWSRAMVDARRPARTMLHYFMTYFYSPISTIVSEVL